MNPCLHVWPHSIGGGVTEAARTYAKAIKALNIDQIVITPLFTKYSPDINCRILRIPFLGSGGFVNHVLAAIFLAIMSYFKKPSFILLHNGSLVPILSRLTATPLIAVAHGGRSERFRNAQGIIAVNKKIAESLRIVGYSKRLSVIETPVVAPCSVAKFGNEHFDLGSLGLLEHSKGYDILLNAISTLARRKKNISLAIGGDGRERANLQQLALSLGVENHVKFLGWIENKYDFFNSVSIYVQPSRSETWGLAIREAMICGKPVISTQCDGPAEYIIHRKTGILVDVGDAEHLANAIEDLIDNKHLQTEISAEARRKMLDENCFEKFTQKIGLILNQSLIFDLINWSQQSAE